MNPSTLRHVRAVMHCLAVACALVASTLLAGCAGQEAKVRTYSCPRSESWFERNQAADGSFAGLDGKPDVEATALALLALLGDGSSLRSGPWRKLAKKAFRWLRQRQANTGAYSTDTRAHGIATYAIVEAIGLSEYKGNVAVELRNETQRAIDELLRRWGKDGCFGSQPDVATTSWCLCALQSARHFGHARVPSHGELLRWFDEHPSQTPLAAACELHHRLLADQHPDEHPAHERTLELAGQADPDDVEACLWATCALFRYGGKPWRQWQRTLKAPVVDTQRLDGEHRGSWDPPPDAGRVEVTAQRVLTLEVYFRYSRLIR